MPAPAQAARAAAQEERRASGRAAGPSGATAAAAPAAAAGSGAVPAALTYHAAPGLADALEAHLRELADEVAVARLQARPPGPPGPCCFLSLPTGAGKAAGAGCGHSSAPRRRSITPLACGAALRPPATGSWGAGAWGQAVSRGRARCSGRGARVQWRGALQAQVEAARGPQRSGQKGAAGQPRSGRRCRLCAGARRAAAATGGGQPGRRARRASPGGARVCKARLPRRGGRAAGACCGRRPEAPCAAGRPPDWRGSGGRPMVGDWQLARGG